MKAVTEFSIFTLKKAIQDKAALASAGKTPEEIQENLGQSLKLEGEKLGYLIQSLEIASTNTENLKRVLVVRLSEGEKAPSKAIQVEELYFIPEFYAQIRPTQSATPSSKGGRGGKGGGRGAGAPKSSPWGLSPEENAMKNKKSAIK